MVTSTENDLPMRATCEEILAFARRCRVPRLRALGEFADGELVIPEGTYRGLRFRRHRQPFAGLLLDAMSTGRWPRTAIVGCVQAGKTLLGWVTPLLYHLFELNETVICGIPTADVAGDKWAEEIEPAIRASRYAHLLPKRGPGSRGGTIRDRVKFRNGATLRFMSGRGRDEQRSSFTARVVLVTEVDKFDEAGEASKESDPITQLENRASATDAPDRRIYLECTASYPTGRIWREYTSGTCSRIAVPCPHCGGYVTPEREDLVGWQDAAGKEEARRAACFRCPSCETRLSDDDRRAMNLAGVLVHRGQEIAPDGTITGPEPDTDTLGFRWNAFNNLFWSPGTIGAVEWTAAHAEDEENAEKEALQFYWARPYEPPEIDLTPLDTQQVKSRVSLLGKGVCPTQTVFLTLGIDIGKWLAHWTLIAWQPGGAAHVADYDLVELDADRLGTERACLVGLREFRDRIEAGWIRDGSGEQITPAQIWIDAAYQDSREAVYQFCRESSTSLIDARYRPCWGYGQTQERGFKHYSHPDRTDQNVRLVGHHFHYTRARKAKLLLVRLNADYYKSDVHQRLAIEPTAPEAMTLYHASRGHHNKFAHHICAEKPKQVFTPGRGMEVVWEKVAKNNHWLDATSLAVAAGRACGAAGPIPSAQPATAPKADDQAGWFARQKRKGGK